MQNSGVADFENLILREKTGFSPIFTSCQNVVILGSRHPYKHFINKFTYEYTLCTVYKSISYDKKIKAKKRV